MPIGATTAAVSAASSLGGAALQSGAAGDAAKAAQQAADKNIAFNNQVYSSAQSNINPYIQQGQSSNQALGGLLGTNGDQAAQDAFKNYLNSTNYQFQLGQGLQGIEYANAPAFNSGATGKALNNYAQGQAGNALQGYEQLLGGQAGLGLQGASALSGVGTNIAGQNAAANNSAASAAGGAAITGANAWQNALKGVGGSLSSYAAGQGGGQTSTTPYSALTNYPSVGANSPTIGALNTSAPIPVWS